MIKLIYTALLMLILAGCATLPAKQRALNQNLSWAQRKAQLTSIKTWEIKGHIGGQSKQQNKTQSFSASVAWEQNSEIYKIYIFGPLGADMTLLNGSPNQVTLTTSNKQKITGPNAETLLRSQFGWTLPVSNLYYWVRGLPAPDAPNSTHFDAYHHLTDLQQQGWNIRYLQYTGVNGQYDLPSKIFMERNGLKLRIVISKWQLNKST